MMTTTSFWYQAGLNAVGPFVTAIVGSLVIGILVQAIARSAHDRRTARELRYALIAELTGVAAKLDGRLQMYRRTSNLLARAEEEIKAKPPEEARPSTPHQRRWRSWRSTQAAPPPELAALRDQCRELRGILDEQYLESRRDGEVLEARLVAHFIDPRVQTAWHALIDCLIIRYCDAINTPGLKFVLKAHAYGTDGRFHSGMRLRELDGGDRWMRLEQVHKWHLQATAAFVLDLPLRGTRSTLWQRVLKRGRGRHRDAPTQGASTYQWTKDREPDGTPVGGPHQALPV